jgi:hypothetical protein
LKQLLQPNFSDRLDDSVKRFWRSILRQRPLAPTRGSDASFFARVS